MRILSMFKTKQDVHVNRSLLWSSQPFLNLEKQKSKMFLFFLLLPCLWWWWIFIMETNVWIPTMLSFRNVAFFCFHPVPSCVKWPSGLVPLKIQGWLPEELLPAMTHTHVTPSTRLQGSYTLISSRMEGSSKTKPQNCLENPPYSGMITRSVVLTLLCSWCLCGVCLLFVFTFGSVEAARHIRDEKNSFEAWGPRVFKTTLVSSLVWPWKEGRRGGEEGKEEFGSDPIVNPCCLGPLSGQPQDWLWAPGGAQHQAELAMVLEELF